MAHGIKHLPRRSGVGMRNVKTPHPWRETLARARAHSPSKFLAWKPVPWFKGHGIAWSNAYMQGYDCQVVDCGRSSRGPLDDLDFMTDVMDHEQLHHDAESGV